MAESATDLDKLSITIDKDGVAVLSGIHYSDLRSLLTAASLHRFDHPFEAKALEGALQDVQHENNLEGAAWHLHQRAVLEAMDAHMKNAIRAGDGDFWIASAKESLKFDLASLEDDVREAEAAAAKAADSSEPDSLSALSSKIQEIGRSLDSAVRELGALAKERAKADKAARRAARRKTT